MKKFLAIILILLCGCYSNYDIVISKLPKDEQKYEHRTVDSILKYYFTNEAYAVIKDIPMVDGFAKTPYVVGINGQSTIASLLIGNGYGRKVVMTEKALQNWGVGAIIHEYIHHLDDMTRDGDCDFIDRDNFISAYKLMSNDMMYAGIVLFVEPRANNWFTDTFGVGEYSEHIAYTGVHIALHNSPEYMQNVFRKILRSRT